VTRVDATDPEALRRAVETVLGRGRSVGSLLPAGYDLATVAARYAELLGVG
jgi:hypothetical protein